jgi:Family of unknown function (DUF6338)
MSDFVLNAAEVGNVVVYVAPGYLAQLGYRARFPAPERSTGQTLVVSVVLSLPLVALADALIGGSHSAKDLGYALALTAGAYVIGYLAASVRARHRAKALLARLGYHSAPEGSIYAQTLKHLPDDQAVIVEMKDGRSIYGVPRTGPEFDGDGIRELFLTFPEARPPGGEWSSIGAGVIVPLDEVSTIVMFMDPTIPRNNGLVAEAS